MPDPEVPETPTSRQDVHVTSFCQFPGTDPVEVHRVIRGELGEPNLAVLPQLPDRGVGADALGRSATLVEDLGFDLQPHGWRIGVPDGVDARRARSVLRSDENLLADVLGAETKAPTRLKLTVTGPWSLAAGLYLGSGERAISDYGARRDIIEAYAHGVRAHLDRLRRATGVQQLTVQLDEPLLPAVLAGTVPTASGYRTLRSVPRAEVREHTTAFLQTLGEPDSDSPVRPIVNVPCADRGWDELVALLHACGAGGFLVDPAPLGHRDWERVAGLVEAGAQIFLQALAPGGRAPGVVQAVATILRPWRQLGLPLTSLGQLTLMPVGSFVDRTATEVRDCLARLTEYAQALEQTRVDS